MRYFRRILLKLWRRRRFEQDLESELAFHRQMAQEHGNTIPFGNLPGVEEQARDLWRFALVEDLCRDLLYALRSLRRTPGFATAAILTLALGIGANTAIFTLLERVMLRSLPVRQPDQLVEILFDRGGGPATAFSYPALQYFREHNQVFSAVIASSTTDFHIRIEGQALDRLTGQYVTGDYFSTLGVDTITGRPIAPDDARAGAANAVAVISHAMWINRFGAAQDVIGKKLVVESVPFTVIGVAPAAFHGLEVGKEILFWIPLEMAPQVGRPSSPVSAGTKWLQLVGRLKPGVSIPGAHEELRVLFQPAVIDKELELNAQHGTGAMSGAEIQKQSPLLEPASLGLSTPRRQFSKPLIILMIIVAILLLIACTNVANLLFVRSLSREKELFLRLSLGASRSRLIRQLLTESAALAVAGALLGIVAARFASKYLAAFLSNARPPVMIDISPDLTTLGFTTVVACFTVIAFGLLPAFRGSDIDVSSKLKGSTPAGSAENRSLSGVLVVVQVALVMVLTLGAGLFLRTLQNLDSTDLGFDRSKVLLVTFDPFGSGQSPEKLKTLSWELLEKIQSLPGVRTASLGGFPISGGSGTNFNFQIDHVAGGPSTLARNVYVNRIGPKYFATLGAPVIAGREFGPEDTAGAHAVVLVNQTFARRYLGNGTPIGRQIVQNGKALEIVGLVGDTRYTDVRAAMEPTVFYPSFQQPTVSYQLLIRTDRDPQLMASAVRSEIRSLLGNISIRERTLEDHINASLARDRLLTVLAASFGGLALLLAVVGLYGVVSHTVERRTREIGIRIALGLDSRNAVAMVLHEVFVLVGLGIVIGLPVAVAVARSLSGLLYGLPPDDPLTILVSVVALLLTALCAAFIPARRASRVDPMIAIRID